MDVSTKNSLNFRLFALSTLIPMGVMLAAMMLKPLWRDEYWSLFFADTSMGFEELVTGRLRNESHPPLYYLLLRAWHSIIPTHFGERALSLALLIPTGFILRALTPTEKRRALYLFLLICLGSYWIIYFSTELRPYILLFCLTSLSVFLMPHLIAEKPPKLIIYLLWILVGAGLSLTHYFGPLWFACLGLAAGIAALRAGYKGRFSLIGVVSLIGILPAVGWITYAAQHIDISEQTSSEPFFSQFLFAANQFLRGLLVKTFASNPIVTILGFGGLITAIRGRDRVDGVLMSAAAFVIVGAFILHFTFIPLIKERAFIVIMPGLLWIFAKQLDLKSGHKLARFIPIAAVIMPFIFAGEYFKDREKISDIRKSVLPYAEACEGQPILVYYRPSSHAQFYKEISQDILIFKKNGVNFSPTLVDAASVVTPIESTCPLKAAAFILRRGDDQFQNDAIATLESAGLQMNTVTETPFGKRRNILWVAK